MIYLVSLQDHFVGITRLIEGLRSEIRTLRHVTYERLFYSMKAPVGHYVFTDIDRLSHYEKETVIGLADALRRVHPAVRILNDPRKVLDRYPLIRLLAQKGLNGFGATRLDDGSRPSRYPVFIRCEDSHHGADTDLLHSPEDLERAIVDLSARGKVLKRRIAVEFCAQRDADGMYRKYGVINIAGTLVPQHVLRAEHWMVKRFRNEKDAEAEAFELDFVRRNPHRDYLAQIFELAHIDFGRLDYGLVDGTVQVFEINTNPNLPRAADRADGNNEKRRLIREPLVAALRAIDVPLPPAQPVKFGLPHPVYHQMRPWRPIHNMVGRLRRTLHQYPKVKRFVPGRFW